MLFRSKAKEIFGVNDIVSQKLDGAIKNYERIYKGFPDWIDEDEDIKTINFAKSLCSETARLTMLAAKVTADGSARAAWVQKQIDSVYYNLRDWVEYACAAGTVILKPNGKTVDMYPLKDVVITDCENGKITGIVFINKDTVNDKYYTRFEYHRYVNDRYVITNRCFVSDSQNSPDEFVEIKDTPWSDMKEEDWLLNIQKPLFGVLRTPHANNIEIESPLGLAIFADAIEELKDLDIAYSRNAQEIYDSKRTVLLDSDRLMMSGHKVGAVSEALMKVKRKMLGLPRYVRNVLGDGKDSFYQEINPTISTEERLKGINALLSQIGYKVGYSNGYFVFNESTGIQTATGVEAEQQRTIQFIKDCRDKLQECLEDVIYALNVFADLYALAPLGVCEVVYDFGDITYNREEDRARWLSYANANRIPFYYYLMKFEGLSEEEAKALVALAQPKQPTLFGGEE